MIKKQSIVALVLLLLIPLVSVVGGILFSLINPERAAGHPNYVRNYHLLHQLRISCILGSLAIGALLWILVCVLVIRSKKRSYLWLPLAVLGPFGFAVLGMLNDREPSGTDRYDRFARNLSGPVRVAYELCTFVFIWGIAYQAMVAKRMLMIGLEAVAAGVPAAQIMDLQNASSGMWAFGEGMEVMFLVALFYLLRPLVFSTALLLVARVASPKSG